MVLGGGGGGGHGKHTHSTAADQPALLPDYKIAWFCGGGGLVWGGEMIMNCFIPAKSSLSGRGGWGGGGDDKHTHSTEPAQPAL